MMKNSKAFIVFFLALTFTAGPFTIANAQEQHQLLSNVLGDHVQDGLVDYRNLCKDNRLEEYWEQLSETDVGSLSKEDSMAYWINAYNAFTLQLICRNYPLKSIGELHSGGLILASVTGKTAWDKPFITIKGKTYTLGHIEHKILRPQYKDPRIHFAIVCAARSCPPLRSEAYEGFKLEDQLNDQGKVFIVTRDDLNAFDLEKKTAHLSPIFSWFLKDFGRNSRELLKYLAAYLPEGLSSDIQTNVSSWKIKYNKYDWGLNEQ